MPMSSYPLDSLPTADVNDLHGVQIGQRIAYLFTGTGGRVEWRGGTVVGNDRIAGRMFVTCDGESPYVADWFIYGDGTDDLAIL